jgi:hypothetical protein
VGTGGNVIIGNIMTSCDVDVSQTSGRNVIASNVMTTGTITDSGLGTDIYAGLNVI